jgi:hypothetical protein
MVTIFRDIAFSFAEVKVNKTYIIDELEIVAEWAPARKIFTSPQSENGISLCAGPLVEDGG